MNVEIIGVCHHKGEIQTYGENGFKKAEVIIATVEQYSQYYPVELLQHNTDLLDDFEEGKNYKVTCALRGKLVETQTGTRPFLSLVGFKVEPV